MRPRPWQPLGCLALQLVPLWAVAAVVDTVGLTPAGSWPYLFAAASLTVGCSSWGLGLTLVTGLVGGLADDPAVQRGATWVGAVVAVPFGLLGMAGAVAWLAGSGALADVLMALALLTGGVVALLPLVGLVRTRRTA